MQTSLEGRRWPHYRHLYIILPDFSISGFCSLSQVTFLSSTTGPCLSSFLLSSAYHAPFRDLSPLALLQDSALRSAFPSGHLPSSSSSLPKLLLRTWAAQPDSRARWAASARRIPRPGAARRPRRASSLWSTLTAVPRIAFLSSFRPSVLPASSCCQPRLWSPLPSCPRPLPLRGLGRPLPMRLGWCAVPAQSLYREGRKRRWSGRQGGGALVSPPRGCWLGSPSATEKRRWCPGARSVWPLQEWGEGRESKPAPLHLSLRLRKAQGFGLPGSKHPMTRQPLE